MPKEMNMAKWNWKSRYVDPASRIDITECHSRLRWLQNCDIPCGPLLKFKLETFAEIQVENQTKIRTSGERRVKCKLEVLHLFRCFTHTPSRRRVEN